LAAIRFFLLQDVVSLLQFTLFCLLLVNQRQWQLWLACSGRDNILRQVQGNAFRSRLAAFTLGQQIRRYKARVSRPAKKQQHAKMNCGGDRYGAGPPFLSGLMAQTERRCLRAATQKRPHKSPSVLDGLYYCIVTLARVRHQNTAQKAWAAGYSANSGRELSFNIFAIRQAAQ